MFEIPAFRLAYKRLQGFSLSGLLRKSHAPSARVVPARTRPPAGCLPARPALVRATLPAALQQALRATHTTRMPSCPACHHFHTQLLTLGYGHARAASAASAPDLAIPPPTPLWHTGVIALPWPLARPALLTQAAPPH